MSDRRRRAVALVAIAAVGLAAAATAVAAPAGTSRGPNTPTGPYVLPVGDGVATKSLLTVSDAEAAGDGYEMVGIPDGLGAYRDPDSRDFTLLMNHELQPTSARCGVMGRQGAFVAELGDRLRHVRGRGGQGPDRPGHPLLGLPDARVPRDPFDRRRQPARCDRHVPRPARLHSGASARAASPSPASSTTPRRSVATAARSTSATRRSATRAACSAITNDGQAQQLPRLGLFSWENTLAADTGSDVTLTIGMEDTATGQLWVYIGTKQRTGNAFDKAGLTNGKDYVVDLANEAVDATPSSARRTARASRRGSRSVPTKRSTGIAPALGRTPRQRRRD